jgi:hypothetical protein
MGCMDNHHFKGERGRRFDHRAQQEQDTEDLLLIEDISEICYSFFLTTE